MAAISYERLCVARARLADAFPECDNPESPAYATVLLIDRAFEALWIHRRRKAVALYSAAMAGPHGNVLSTPRPSRITAEAVAAALERLESICNSRQDLRRNGPHEQSPEGRCLSCLRTAGEYLALGGTAAQREVRGLTAERLYREALAQNLF